MKLLLTIAITDGPLKGAAYACEVDDVPEAQLTSAGYMLTTDVEQRYLRPAVYAAMGPLLLDLDKLKRQH